MFDVFCLGVALAVGQGSPAPMPPAIAGQATITQGLPARIPAALPTVGVPGIPVVQNKDAPVAPAEPKKEEEKKEDEKKPEEKGHFMQLVEGSCLGSVLEENKIKVDGWAAMSYTYGNNRNGASNLPLAWNDRANAFLLQQFWVNIEKPIDTDSKEVNSGWKVAMLYGSDYRFTLIRGFLNNQMKNPRFDIQEPNGYQQNIYGFDIPLFYANAWLPGVGGEGTEVAVGRMFTPFGYESVMVPSNPLMSHTYAFQWAPPFFHVGVMANTKVDKNFSVKNMIVNGNDVFFDGSQEWRYVGAATWTSDDEKSVLAVGTTLGRGKFNSSKPHGPAQGYTTISDDYEPFGRNNFNVFDLTFTQKIDDAFSVGFEAIFGYEQCVPAVATGSITNFGGTAGTATWFSLVKYLNYNFSEQVSGCARAEAFYDAEGARTGFEGWYYAGTLGLQFKPKDSVIFRPEIRYDYNDYSRPFNGNHGLFTAGADLIFKF